MTAYRWKPGASVAVDAQLAGDRLEWLREQTGGTLTPQQVLDDARSNNSPLHKAFEWENDAAAEKYRLWQARYLMACLVVTVEVAKGDDRPVKAFVNVGKSEERRYVPTAVAMGDAEMRAEILARARREVRSWRQKYAELTELAAIFAAIDGDAA